MTASKDKLVRWASRALGLAFVWAAVSKLPDLSAFVDSMDAYRLPFPNMLVRGAAVALPGVELGLGILLLTGVWLRAALRCVAGLLLVFLVVLGQAWLRGLPVTCSCFDLSLFGVQDKYTNLAKLFDSIEFAFSRDLLLLSFTAFLLLRCRRPPAA
jgi:uncharacterized membrane protein YphA (DoxX/SURF4 family)